MKRHWLILLAVVTSLLATVVLAAPAVSSVQALITSRQIKDHTIQVRDLSPNAVRALRGKRGAQGAPGAQGAQGAQGVPGAPGVSGGFDPSKITYVTGPDTVVPANDVEVAEATCPAGTRAISGGFYSSIGIPAWSQTLDGNTWVVMVNNFDNPIPITVNAFVVCASR